MSAQNVTMDARHVLVQALGLPSVGRVAGDMSVDRTSLVFREAYRGIGVADVFTAEGTPRQVLALLERAAAQVRALLPTCLRCAEPIIDAVPANMSTEDSGLCLRCGDPDGTRDPDRATDAVAGESCGMYVGAGHACALAADHRVDLCECATGCCSWGSWTDRHTGRPVHPALARTTGAPACPPPATSVDERAVPSS